MKDIVYILFASSCLFLKASNLVSIILYSIVCLYNGWFLAALPSYYLLIFRKNRANFGFLSIIPICILCFSVGLQFLSHNVVDAQLLVATLQSNNILATLENIIGLIVSYAMYIRNILPLDQNVSNSLYYECSSYVASPWWYLTAQMLPEYSNYFSVLLSILQCLMAILLYLNVSVFDPTIGMYLTLLLINYFRSDVTLVELWISITLLLKSEQIVTKMANIYWIVIGMLVPTVLIPLYSHLWTNKGTVNANFVFFQCYCLWVFVGLGFVEFVKSFLASLV